MWNVYTFKNCRIVILLSLCEFLINSTRNKHAKTSSIINIFQFTECWIISNVPLYHLQPLILYYKQIVSSWGKFASFYCNTLFQTIAMLHTPTVLNSLLAVLSVWMKKKNRQKCKIGKSIILKTRAILFLC